MLQEGNNTIDITMDFIAPIPTDTIFAHRYGTELESIYLIGDFALRPDMRLLNQWNTEKMLLGLLLKTSAFTKSVCDGKGTFGV